MTNRNVTNLLAILFVTVLGPLFAGTEDNIVLIDFHKKPKDLQVCGVYLEKGFIVTDGNTIGRETRVEVTFFKGSDKEQKLNGSVIFNLDLAIIAVTAKNAILPNDISFADRSEIKESISVRLWRFNKTFSSLEMKVSKVLNDREPHEIFELPGYYQDVTGCPVTLSDGRLAGITTRSGNYFNAMNSGLIQDFFKGWPQSGSVVCVERSGNTFTYRCINNRVFDPLDRAKKLAIVYWTGPYDSDRKFTRSAIGPSMPGDSKLSIVKLQWDPRKAAYEGSFTFQDDGTNDLFYGLVNLSDDNTIAHNISNPMRANRHRRLEVVDMPAEDRALFTPKKAPPAAKKNSQQKRIFPAVSFRNVHPTSFFPLAQGNTWTYERKQHYARREVGGLRYGFENKKGGFQRVTSQEYGSNHEETYVVSKLVGDRAWLKVYAPKVGKPEYLRDSRYTLAKEGILEWTVENGTFHVLNEILHEKKNNTYSLTDRKLIVLDGPKLTRESLSAANWTDSVGNKVTWTTFERKLETHAGTFLSYLKVRIKGNLMYNRRYQIISYYYPGVGMIKEEYWLEARVDRPDGTVDMSMILAHELNLKDFSVADLKVQGK